MKKLFIISIIFSFFSIPAIAYGFDYVINDFNFYPTPNTPKPAKGVPYTDPVFHTTITRITDARTDAPGSKYNYCQPGYPKHDIENSDGTKLLIQCASGSGWHIWNANSPYNKIQQIIYYPGSTGQPIDFRWDATDPNVGYFQYRNQFWKYEVAQAKTTVLYDFSSDFTPPEGALLVGVEMAEEGTPSDDSRYWAFRVRYYSATHSPTWWTHAIIVFDKDFFGKNQGKIISRIDETHPNFKGAGFISMSPSGKYVWVGDTHYIYPRDLSSVRAGKLNAGHADMAYSAEDREVIFGFVYRGTALGGFWLAMEDLETGIVTPLCLKTGAVHISGNSYDKPGWGIVSQYMADGGSSTNTGVESKWGNYEVYIVELTTRTDPFPRVWRLAKTYTYIGGRYDYANSPFAKINKQGTKVWFGSGWGQSYAGVGGQFDVYQIDLPSTWYEDLKVISSDITPPSAPTGVIVT